MEAAGGAVHGAQHRVEIGDVGADQLASRIEVFDAAGGQVVQHPHAVAGGGQRVGEVGSR